MASEGSPAATFALGLPSPNPFTTEARVTVGAAPGTDVRATLYDVLGRQVAVVHDGPLAGDLRVSGGTLTPGVYVLRVRTAEGEQAVRLVRQ